MATTFEPGALSGLSLRFLDDSLEKHYQQEEGRTGLTGFRLTAAASAILWAVAAVLIPGATDLPAGMTYLVAGLMVLASLICVGSTRWASTLNRKHAIISLLTAANGLVILTLAEAAGLLEGYAVAAIMLLFAFAFVARTRFVFAAMRTLIIAAGFAYFVARYERPRNLILDGFLFVAASGGTLLALRRLERDRRHAHHQQILMSQQAEELKREKDESERLLLNVLPASVSVRLRRGEYPIADVYESVSVLFADIVGFTSLAARLSPDEVIRLLNTLFVRFDGLVADLQLEKIKTIGDSYMVAGGFLDPLGPHAEKMVDLGMGMVASTSDLVFWGPELVLRVGIHSGPAAGGVIGTRRFAYDVWGDTVNVASRLEEFGVPGRVHISETTREMLGDRFLVESRGPMELRGHSPINTFLIVGKVPLLHQAARVGAEA